MSDESTNREKRFSTGMIAGLCLALFFGISLFIRAYLPYDHVFIGEWIKFTSVDAYFHMRLVDNLVHNFPNLIDFDPYLLYPFGMNLDNIHFFDWSLAGIIWVIGLGSPTQHTIDVISVYFPAVLGALTVIPVFFIGKELFGRWAGVIAAGLIAILPGEFLGRSILGFTDHHIAETLLTAFTMMFLIMSVKRANESGLTVQHLRNRDWKVIRKPVIYSLLTGLSLGIYLVTWVGGLLFVFIILLYLFIQFIIDHLKRNSTDYLLPAGTITFFISFIIYVTFVGGTFSSRPSSVIPWLSLLMAAFLPIILHIISRRFKVWKLKLYYYPVTLLVLGAVALFVGRAIYPDFMRNVLDVFNLSASRTIIEMQPFLRPRGEWTIGLAWGNFNTGFFLASACILYSIVYFILRIFIGNKISEFKMGNIRIFPESFAAEKNILLIWSLVILLATLGQRRFAYYMAVNVALLSAFLSWQFFRLNKEAHPSAKHLNIFVSLVAVIFLIFYSGISPAIVAILVAMLIAYIFWQFLQAFGLLQLSKTRLEPQKKSKHKGRSPAGFSSALYYTNIAVVGIVIFILVFFPNIKPATSIASLVQFAPPNSWVRSLDWMKENTPEPFGDSNFYYGLHEPPMPGEQYDYPDSAYAVMAWVDYGYWINRIAHRPVNLTPGPGGFYVATYFLSQGEDSTQEVEWKTRWGQEIIPESDIIDKLGAKYIMLDNQTVTSKFWALASWAKQERTQYFDAYFVPQEEDKLVPVTLFHPEYYRSLAIRLYNFDGKAVTPEQTIVISYEETPFQEGGAVKVVNNIEFFPSYEEATSYISSQKSGQFRIVSDSPFVSPVPLEELEHFKLVYSSPESSPQPGVSNVPNVKIFEYVE